MITLSSRNSVSSHIFQQVWTLKNTATNWTWFQDGPTDLPDGHKVRRFSSLDLISGYWTIWGATESRENTAFVTPKSELSRTPSELSSTQDKLDSVPRRPGPTDSPDSHKAQRRAFLKRRGRRYICARQKSYTMNYVKCYGMCAHSRPDTYYPRRMTQMDSTEHYHFQPNGLGHTSASQYKVQHYITDCDTSMSTHLYDSE